tara:strand:- start:1315 stop:1980 length:666 start_codon:yes stop_codon:yes gene_type:complete
MQLANLKMMDRALKERIIGAVVLVTFVVLVVPIFLDGPPQEGEVISERVLLPGQEGQDTKTVVLDRERSEPIPVASGAQNTSKAPADIVPKASELAAQQPADTGSDVPAVANQPATAESTPEPSEPKPEPKIEVRPTPPPAASTTGMWAVQLGSFSNKENAEKLAADLRKQAYAAFLSQLQTENGQLHRVRIGPQKDREAAELMAARLAKVGHKGQVVPHP